MPQTIEIYLQKKSVTVYLFHKPDYLIVSSKRKIHLIRTAIIPIHIKNAHTTFPDLFEYQSVIEDPDTQSQYGFVLFTNRGGGVNLPSPNNYTMKKAFTLSIVSFFLFLIWSNARAQDLSIEGNATIESLSGAGTRMVTVLPDGTLDQQAITGGSSISDADGDTQIQCEESPNEDIIRFDLGGAELMRLENATLHLGNPIGAVFIGNNAGVADNSSWANTFVGNRAGEGNVFGYANTGIGNMVFLMNDMGSENVAVGDEVFGLLETGNQNTALGNRAMFANVGGNNNVAVGYEALVSNTAAGNTGVGHQAGQLLAASENCTFLGAGADVSGLATLPLTNSTALGAGTTVDASNQIRVGNAAVMSIGGFQAWTNLSDGRFKRKVENDVPGLEFVLQLQPVTYNLDVNGLAEHLNEDVVYENGKAIKIQPNKATRESRNAKSKVRFSGFIAQDVEEAAQKIGYDFSGVDKPQNDQSLYGLRYAEFTVPLVKAVQQLHGESAELRVRSKALEVENEQQDAIIEQQAEEILNQRTEIAELHQRLSKVEALMERLDTDMEHCCETQSQGKAENELLEEKTETKAYLEQNVPNPSNKNTRINYHLPEGSKAAQLQISTLGGKLVKTYALIHIGRGSVTVKSGQLPAGTYIYSLVIDNVVLDSPEFKFQVQHIGEKMMGG